ncbi:MAG: acyl carrier protein [Oscillospiraceae bacterium]|nr:acyl carrier protein [Oscillospiraceae bacterium]MBQ8731912.1 acyl carrier protein [Oscillospiraceae bacterium]
MVFEKVKTIIADQLAIDEDSITMESNVIDDLGADSLDVVDVLSQLQDEFSVDVPDSEIENMKTIGDIVNYIENNL